MTTRTASCVCGQLSATCEGEPVRVSVCHCLACQKRSGSSFAAQARFPADKVVTSGEAKVFHRTADSGERLAAEIPNARLHRVENASHWIPHDTPETFASEIDAFLKEG